MVSKVGLLRRVRDAAHIALLIGIFAALFPAPLFAASTVTLVWDSSTSTNIAGYRVYYGPASRTYTNSLTVGNATTTSISNLITGAIYYFTATAYDTYDLESDFSKEVGFTNILLAPPTIVLTSPANNSVFTEPATISLAANVTPNGHTIAKVQFFSGTTLLGENNNTPYDFTWSGVPAGNYGLSAQAVYDSGSTVASASANVIVLTAKPVFGLTFDADSGTYTAPFVASNGTLSQSVQTGLTNGGRAVYTFSVTNAGNYLVSAMVIAPGLGQNSLYVNIDAEPTDPLMIWDIPVSSVLTNATVSWRGSGNGDPASSEYNPAIFALSAGTHQLIIVGREPNTTLGTISIAATPPPTIALTSPADNAAFTAPANISLVANVTANGHTISKVQFYEGATLLGEHTNAPYAFSWSSVAAGNYSLRAQVVYDSGSTVASTPANVTVTNLPPPIIALTSPADNAAFTAPATIRLAANVTANGHTITKVQFYNGTTLLREDTTPPYAFNWSSVAAGIYSLSAQVVYDSGSTVVSAIADVMVTNPAPPTIVLTAPADNAAFTAPATISLAANVTANGHTITKVQFYDGASLLSEDTSAPYVFTWSSVAAGNYSLTAQAVYDSGSTVASTTASVTVTNQLPPTIALTSPADNAAFTAPAAISLAANVTANGHTVTKVQFYNGADLLAEDTTAPYVFTWSSVAAGNYSFSAQAIYDSGSSITSTAADVTVTNLLPPTVALTSPTNYSAFTDPATISLAADVTANGHPITSVQFYNGAILLSEVTNAPYAFTWDTVPAGTYSLTARLVYDNGATLDSTPAANVVVEAAQPAESPVIVLTSPANKSAAPAPATLTLAASVTPKGHSITKVQFYNGATLLGEIANAPYHYTWRGVAAGNYSLKAQAVFDSGSTVASPASIVAITKEVPPAVELTSPADNSALTAPANISLAANVSSNGHTITKVQFYNGDTLLSEDTTAPYAFTWSSIAAGNYTLTAQAVYDSGSIVISGVANVTVTNLLPPTIAMTSPAQHATFTEPATINLAANASAKGHPVAKVQFFNGTTLLGEDATAPYTFTWSSVTAGSYSLTARLVYDAGLTLDSTPPISVRVVAAKPDDTPPTISSIADQTTLQETPTPPISFTIGDAETDASSLTLYATSSNPELVPTNNIVFGGSDTNRTITLTPLYGATGNVAITVFVSDGTLTTNVTFQLAVTDTLIPSRLGLNILPPNLFTKSVTNSSAYNGLFYQDDAVRLTSAGSFTLSVTPRGTYSGRLQIGTKRLSFSGQLNSQRTGATKVISRRDGPSLTLDFQFVTDGHSDQLFGHLTDGTWTSTLYGDRAVFGRGITAPFAGSYTLVIPGYDANPSLPAGDGFGTLKVTTSGQVSFVGTLADGTKVSQGATVSRNGAWPLYLPLYSGKGSLMSWMAFASNTNSDLAGRLIWLKQPGTTSKYYRAGFSCECDAFGSTYLRADPILKLSTASLTFCGGSLASGITNAITIGPRNAVSTPGRQLRLTFSSTTGTFSGAFLDPASGKSLPFSGVVFQKLNAAYGSLFGTGEQTSEVVLTPP